MTMWRGLHNPDYHSPWLDGIRALCTICQQDCEADDVCYCCQRNAEVERLTAERDALRASVQRVRDVLGDVGK